MEGVSADAPLGPAPLACPRERLLAYGPEALSTRELLEVLVATRARPLLRGFGTLRQLGLASPKMECLVQLLFQAIRKLY